MLNQELFELVVAVKDTDFICYPIIAQYQKQQQLETDDFEWVHIVYAIHSEEPVVFYISFINSTNELPEYRFAEYVFQVNKSSFSELLYLVSYYGFFKVDGDNFSIFKNNYPSNNKCCYFEDTFGKLLYHYQLEQLYCSLTQCNIEEAIAFRKAINLKRHSAFEKTKTIKLPSGETLFDIITQYRHRDFTLYPKIKEALALYNYLNP